MANNAQDSGSTVVEVLPPAPAIPSDAIRNAYAEEPRNTLQSLPDLVASFNGNKFTFLVYLMEHPEATFAECYRAAGVGEKAYYRWRATDRRFVEAQARIVAAKGDVKKELALVALKASAPLVAARMVQCALSDGRDSQRARERILEAAGVLGKDGDLVEGTESIDLIALRIRRTRGR